MSGTYAVVVIELRSEPTPGTFRPVRIQIGIDWGDVDLVNLWLDRLERHRIITPTSIRDWEHPQEEPEPEHEPEPDGEVDPAGLELQLRGVRERRWSRAMGELLARAEAAEAKLLELGSKGGTCSPVSTPRSVVDGDGEVDPVIASLAGKHGVDPAFLEQYLEKIANSPDILDPDADPEE